MNGWRLNQKPCQRKRKGSKPIYLNCKWCDTNTSDFVLMSKNDILAQFKMFSCKNVIITGGEPTLSNHA